MKNLGDLHNFSQSVRLQTGPGGTEYFEKPRTLFWERLFFGVNSPLKSYFPKEIHSGLFGLEIEFKVESQGGRSKRIFQRRSRGANQADYFQFGVLLGYSYLFGIQDLHRENVVLTDCGLQVIDVEVVLSKFTLPHETLLLPFRDTPFERSALSHLVAAPVLEPFSLEALINGFSAVLTVAMKKADSLAAAVQAEINQDKIPIRVLLRDTFRYRDWQNSEIEFLPEEREQLERGDVPYFFKFPACDKLFFYTTPDLNFAEVTLPEIFAAGVKAIGVAPMELFTAERINALFSRGTLFLLRMLLPAAWTGEILTNDAALSVTSEKLAICSAHGNFTAARTRIHKS